MRVARQGSVNAVQKRRQERGNDLDHQSRRALQLVQVRECSAPRQVLEGPQVALATRRFLDYYWNTLEGHRAHAHHCQP